MVELCNCKMLYFNEFENICQVFDNIILWFQIVFYVLMMVCVLKNYIDCFDFFDEKNCGRFEILIFLY